MWEENALISEQGVELEDHGHQKGHRQGDGKGVGKEQT